MLSRSSSDSNRGLTFLRNRGELAEGWYDPSTKQKATSASNVSESTSPLLAQHPRAPDYGRTRTEHQTDPVEESDDDIIGPTLPTQEVPHRRVGPAIPGAEDIVLRQGRQAFFYFIPACSQLTIPFRVGKRRRSGSAC